MTAKSKRAAELEEKRRKIKQKCDELFAAALAKLASAERNREEMPSRFQDHSSKSKVSYVQPVSRESESESESEFESQSCEHCGACLHDTKPRRCLLRVRLVNPSRWRWAGFSSTPDGPVEFAYVLAETVVESDDFVVQVFDGPAVLFGHQDNEFSDAEYECCGVTCFETEPEARAKGNSSRLCRPPGTPKDFFKSFEKYCDGQGDEHMADFPWLDGFDAEDLQHIPRRNV